MKREGGRVKQVRGEWVRGEWVRGSGALVLLVSDSWYSIGL